MAKSAQEKFNELLAEAHETSDAVREMVNASYDRSGGYGYACGVLESILKDAIAELPKARRAQFRAELYRIAQIQKNELLAKTIKAA